jgi:hypothetical protein
MSGRLGREKGAPKMKLSEAILVGSTILAPKAGTLHASTPEGQAGCALGMAAVARGCTFSRNRKPIPPGDSTRALGTAGVWGEWVRDKVRRPCGCWLVPKQMQVQHIITHLFDKHVMGKKADWTLNQLVEWVKTVEPTESSVSLSLSSASLAITILKGRTLTRIGREQTPKKWPRSCHSGILELNQSQVDLMG